MKTNNKFATLQRASTIALMACQIASTSACADYRGYWVDTVQAYQTSHPPVMVGRASYYAEDYQGHPTASGEPYDMYALTAAHPDLPFGTPIRVTNLQNGHSVVVRVNDRGPFRSGRIVDVSWAAAEQLGLFLYGSADVRVEVLG